MLTVRPRERRRGGLIPLLLFGGGLLLAVVIAAGLIGFDATSNLNASNESVVASSERLTVTKQLELRVIDLQTGVRGFVITGAPAFLAPRNRALGQIPRLERRLLAGLPAADRSSLERLFRRIERYMSGVQPRVLSLARRDLQAARRLVATGIGNDEVDAMRREFASFDRAQSAERLRRRSTADSRATRAKAIQLVGLGAVVILVGALIFLVSRGAVSPVRRLAESARRIGEGELEARVPVAGLGEVRELAAGFNSMADSIQDSHEQLQREARLRQAVLEAANDAYMATDAGGRVLVWTPHAEEMFGYAAAEASGRPVEELTLPEEFWPAFHAARENLIEAGGEERALRFEATAMHRGGRRFVVEVSSCAVGSREGWILSSFVRDIDDRVQRSQARRATASVSRVLAETRPEDDPIPAVARSITEAMGWRGASYWRWDEEDGVLRCEYLWDRADAGLGPAAAEVRGRALDPAAPSSHRVVVRAFRDEEAAWRALAAEHEDDDVATHLYAAGIRSVVALPLMGSGGPHGALHFLLGRAKEPSREVLEDLRGVVELAAQVIERRLAEREADRLKDEFSALVSHELRTPLTSIIGYLDVIREGRGSELNEEQAGYLEIIDRNAHRLLRLVGDLLFAAQVEAGTLSLQREEVDLAAVARESIEAAGPRADAQGVRLAIRAEPAPLGGADPERLGQLVDNLLSNALKFTPRDGKVEVRVGVEGENAVLAVADSGMGIPAEDVERLFDRFYRSAGATRGAVPGIGLGLAICQAIAEGHGGRIAVETEMGVGSTFTATLPLDGRQRQDGDGEA